MHPVRSLARTASVGTIAALAACQPTPSVNGPAAAGTPPTESAAPAADQCGASRVQQFVGKPASPANRATVTQLSGSPAVRWLTPDMMITMEYRDDRLTARLSNQGIIASLTCG